MHSDDVNAIIKLYEDRFTELGQDVRTLGWKSEDDQRLRFEVLCDIADLHGASICDVGCGFGQQVEYLESRFGAFSYTGIDISPSLVRRAKELHPHREFLCANMLDAALPTADYFLLSGALNFRVHDNEEFARTMLRRMFDAANKGVALNFLSSYVNFQRPHNYHFNPEAMFSYARSLTRWVTLRHDYPLWEFSLYLYKDPRA
jgi:SAM-dependent methyltransferase